jgi:hypothetical protein
MVRLLLLAPFLFAAAPVRAAEPVAPEGLHVLMINGGGDRENNFASHLSHLRQLAGLLERAQVPRDHVTVLASDGSNPAPDLAVRGPEPEGIWLLEGTALGDLLRHTTSFENSTLAGYSLRPATRAELGRVFGELGERLRPGDTLLVFVTDHGTSNPRDPLDNRITLWGAHESLSVRALRGLLAGLPAQVRVVSLMSQCFSGGFAYLYDLRARDRLPSGAACGYFSSTADRPAYGCYPEVRGVEAVGHGFEFLQALSHRGRFAAAHDSVVLADQSPDVPLRPSARGSNAWRCSTACRACASPAWPRSTGAATSSPRFSTGLRRTPRSGQLRLAISIRRTWMRSWPRGRAWLRAWPCRPCASWNRPSGAGWPSSFCANSYP